MAFSKLIKLILLLFFWSFFAISLLAIVVCLYSKFKNLIALPTGTAIIALIGGLVTSQEDLYDT